MKRSYKCSYRSPTVKRLKQLGRTPKQAVNACKNRRKRGLKALRPKGKRRRRR